ncbi:MAG: PEP-CTERM sorting domain-containing protein [Bryobacteraceae bacterium]
MCVSRTAFALVFSVVFLCGVAAPTARASAVTYTFTATGSGTIGTTNFTDASVTVTAIGDTSTIFEAVSPPFSPDTFFDPTQVSVSISGVGTANFTGSGYIDGYGPLANGYVFDNQTETLAGFGIESDNSDTGNPVFATYNLSTSIGPISGVSMDFISEATTLGALTLTTVTPGTFTAAVSSSPEPSTLALLGVGIAFLGLCKLGNQRQRSF